jgi:hypothetical protein
MEVFNITLKCRVFRFKELLNSSIVRMCKAQKPITSISTAFIVNFCTRLVMLRTWRLSRSWRNCSAMSPDMNPIEHVWDFIGRKINQRNPKCQNIDELRPAILQEWQQFLQERLRRLVRSMTRRVQKFTINAVDILVIGFCALHIKCCTIRALCGLALSSMNIGLSANAWLSKWGTTRGASTLLRYFWPVRLPSRTYNLQSKEKQPQRVTPHP